MSHTVDEATTRIKSLLQWLRARLFFSWSSSIATLIILYLAWNMVPPLIDWALVRAVWSPQNARLCREAIGHGACWAFVADKYRFILFGTFPADQHWRPALTVVILLMLYLLSALRNMKRSRLAYFWLAGLAAIGVLMWGGVFGLSYVENERWGGLTLTLLLATFGLAFAFPLSILLALGRRSAMPVVRGLSIAYIELIRGVPSAAYLAEVVRGGLQAIPRQQEEAAQALGLSYWQRTSYVILPQALRIAIPPLVNTFIGFFKDTSLVVIIGLFDFLTTIKVSLTEPAWTGFSVEAYLFAALGYFVFCYPMSRYSQMIERETVHRQTDIHFQGELR